MSFNITVNLTGAGARKGPGGSLEPTVAGAFKVALQSVKGHAKKDGDGSVSSVEFKASILEGDNAGYVANIYIGLDTTKDGNKRGWRTALLSAGYTESEIDGGDITLSESLFEGKEAWIFFQPRDPNDKASNSDKYFITPEGAQRIIEHGVPANLTARSSNTASVQTSNVAVSAAPVVQAVSAATSIAKPKLGGLKSMLGGGAKA